MRRTAISLVSMVGRAVEETGGQKLTVPAKLGKVLMGEQGPVTVVAVAVVRVKLATLTATTWEATGFLPQLRGALSLALVVAVAVV